MLPAAGLWLLDEGLPLLATGWWSLAPDDWNRATINRAILIRTDHSLALSGCF